MTYPALALQPIGQPLDVLGAYTTASNIGANQARTALMNTQLEEQQRRQRALADFAQRGGFANPTSVGALNQFPDIYSQAIQTMDRQQQMNAMENARAAQRVLVHPEGSPERLAVYRQELERAHAEGRLDAGLYQRYSSQPPTDLFLNGIIDLATPLTGGLSQRQILSLFGYGPSGPSSPAAPAPTAGTGRTARELLQDTGVPGLALSGGMTADPNLGFLAGGNGAALNFPLINQPTAPGQAPAAQAPARPISRQIDLSASEGDGSQTRPYRNIETARHFGAIGSYYRGPDGDVYLYTGSESNALPPIDRPLLPPGPSSAPGPAAPASPAGALLPIDPRALAALAERTTPQAPAPAGLPSVQSPYDQIAAAQAPSARTQPAAQAPAAPAAPATAAPAGLGGLREAIAGMSQQQRLAAMLYMMKGDYGELAKMLSNSAVQEQTAIATKRGEGIGAAQVDLPRAMQSANSILRNIDAVIEDPHLGYITGWQNWGPLAYLPYSSAGHDTMERIRQIQGQEFLQAYNALRGGGQITEAEGAKASAAIGRLSNLSQTDAGYMQALHDARREIWELMNVARMKAGQPTIPYVPHPSVAQPTATPDAEGWINLPGGVRLREAQR